MSSLVYKIHSYNYTQFKLQKELFFSSTISYSNHAMHSFRSLLSPFRSSYIAIDWFFIQSSLRFSVPRIVGICEKDPRCNTWGIFFRTFVEPIDRFVWLCCLNIQIVLEIGQPQQIWNEVSSW